MVFTVAKIGESHACKQIKTQNTKIIRLPSIYTGGGGGGCHMCKDTVPNQSAGCVKCLLKLSH